MKEVTMKVSVVDEYMDDISDIICLSIPCKECPTFNGEYDDCSNLTEYIKKNGITIHIEP